MQESVASAGEGKLRVTCQLVGTNGQGLVAFVFGGELPHVGGQALASPGPQLQGAQLSRCDLWVSTVPGHKDAEVAFAIARELCLTTGEPVSVTAGIHVDSASLDEITVLGANALAAARAALDGLS